jgi:hypothetical protein
VSSFITAGYTPDSSAAAVDANDLSLLKHTGLFSVQLQQPGAEDANQPDAQQAEAADQYQQALDEFRAELADDDDIVRAANDLDDEVIERKYYDIRVPKGHEGGGRFRKLSDRIGHALNEWLSGNGDQHDPLEDFNREQLRLAAKEFGITPRRGASAEELKLALLQDARGRFHGAKSAKAPDAGKPVRFTLKGGGSAPQLSDNPDVKAALGRIPAAGTYREAAEHILAGKQEAGFTADPWGPRTALYADTPLKMARALRTTAATRRRMADAAFKVNPDLPKVRDDRKLAHREADALDALATVVAQIPASQKPSRHRNLDVGVFTEPSGKLSLWEVSDSGERRKRVALADDLAGLESWANEHGEPELAGWAAKKRGGTEAPKAADAPAKASPGEVENAIRAAYRKHGKDGDYVSLAEIRAELGTKYNRADVDAALKRLAVEPDSGANIVPQSNQKALTAADHAAALHIGGQNRHFIHFEDSSPRTGEANVPKAPTRRAPAKDVEAVREQIRKLRDQAETEHTLASMRIGNNPSGSYQANKGEENLANAERLRAEADKLEESIGGPAPKAVAKIHGRDLETLIDEAGLRGKSAAQLKKIADEENVSIPSNVKTVAARQRFIIETLMDHEARRGHDPDRGIRRLQNAVNVLFTPEPAKKATKAVPTAPDVNALRTLDTEARRDALDLRKVDELKALLREQGLPVSGKKRDLVDRLVEHLDGEGTTPAAPASPRTPLAPGGADDLAEEFYRNPKYTEQQILDRLSGLNLAELKKVARATNVALPRGLVKTEAGPVFMPPKKITADELRQHIASTIARDRKLLGVKGLHDAPDLPETKAAPGANAPLRDHLQRYAQSDLMSLASKLDIDLRQPIKRPGPVLTARDLQSSADDPAPFGYRLRTRDELAREIATAAAADHEIQAKVDAHLETLTPLPARTQPTRPGAVRQGKFDNPAVPARAGTSDTPIRWAEGQDPGWDEARTKRARTALRAYGQASFEINESLRGQPVEEPIFPVEQTAAHIAAMDDLMAASRTTAPMEQWRGLRDARGMFGDRLDGDLTGAEWREDAFVSTSSDVRVSQYFATFGGDGMLMRVKVPTGTGAAQVKDVRGEAEALLQRGLKLRIVADHGVQPGWGYRLVDVEVVPADGP